MLLGAAADVSLYIIVSVQRVHIQSTYWYYASKQPSLTALSGGSSTSGAGAGGLATRSWQLHTTCWSHVSL